MVTLRLLSGILCILMPLSIGIFFFLHRRQSKAFVEACLFYACIALTFLSSFVNYIHWLPVSRVLYLFYPFATISIVIFYFFYLHYFTSPSQNIPRWWFFSFCVPIAQFCFSGYIFYLHYPRHDMLENFYAIVNLKDCPPMKLAIKTHQLTTSMIMISLAAFMTLSVFFVTRMIGNPKDDAPKRDEKEIRRFLLMLSISFSVCIVTIYYRFTPEYRAFMEFFWDAGLFCTGYLMYKNVMSKQTEEKSIEKNMVVHSDFGLRLISHFEETKPWRNSELNIEDVASALKSNRTYISKLIKKEFKTKFCDFVNAYRVGETKRLLQNLTILPKADEIARQSGFNSYSAYNKAFQKETGMTPKDYLKSLGKQGKNEA